MVGGLLPPCLRWIFRRDPDSYSHVLFRIQRHHRLDRAYGCRRDLNRVFPFPDGTAPRIPESGEIENLLRKALEVLTPQQPVGQSRLRIKDPRLAGSSVSA
jgi:hypothetical protein